MAHLLIHQSRYCGDQAAVRIALLKDDLYLVQGAKNVAEVFRTSSLTVTLAYGIVLKCCFGMADKAADIYVADTSGCQLKPIAGSHVQRQGRVSYQTHESLLQGLLGTGLAPATDRFESAFNDSLCSLNIHEEWTHFPDLLAFFEDHVGSAVIKAIFGSALLSENPDFLRDLWAYDKVVMSLAKRLPAFWIPGAYELRNKLLLSIRRWHRYARTHPDELDEGQSVDVDPVWGCRMMRDRYKMLLGIENQDHDSVASTDLGFIWA